VTSLPIFVAEATSSTCAHCGGAYLFVCLFVCLFPRRERVHQRKPKRIGFFFFPSLFMKG